MPHLSGACSRELTPGTESAISRPQQFIAATEFSSKVLKISSCQILADFHIFNMPTHENKVKALESKMKLTL